MKDEYDWVIGTKYSYDFTTLLDETKTPYTFDSLSDSKGKLEELREKIKLKDVPGAVWLTSQAVTVDDINKLKARLQSSRY